MAQFRRQLKTTHDTLGSSIIDSPVSQWYTDVYDGQVTLFNIGKGLSTGVIPMGNDPANCDLLVEFPNILKPSYGEATLTGLDLFLYTDNIDLNFDFSVPTLEVYKLREELPTVGTFDTTESKFSKLHFGGSIFDDLPAITDAFSGNGGTLANIKSGDFQQLDDWYIRAQEYWDEAKGGHGAGTGANSDIIGAITRGGYRAKKGGFRDWKKKYGRKRDGEWQLEFKSAGSGLMDHWKPDKGLMTFGTDPQFTRYIYDSAWCMDHWGNLDHFSGLQLVKYKSFPKPMGDDEKSFLAAARANAATAEKTIFHRVQHTPEKSNGIDDNGNANIECFSTPYFSNRGGRNSIRMYNFIKGNTSIEQSYTFGNMDYPTECQIQAMHTRIPKPIPWVRKMASTNEDHMNSVVVEIDFKINNMSKMYRFKNPDGGGDSSTKAIGHHLARSLFFCFSNREVKSKEHLAAHISAINAGTQYNPKTGSTATSQYALVAFATVGPGWNSASPTATRENDGHVKVITSGVNSGHKEGIASTYSYGDDSMLMTAPYVQKQKDYTGSGSDLFMASDLVHTIGSIDEDDTSTTTQGGIGEWYTLKAVQNYLEDNITFYLLNSEGVVQWSYEMKSSPDNSAAVASGADGTNTAGDFDRGFEEGGFLGHLSIWTTNFKIDASRDAYYSTDGTDAIVDVDIGAIRIQGHEASIANCTAGDMRDTATSKRGVMITSTSNSQKYLYNTEHADISNGEMIGSEPITHLLTDDSTTPHPIPSYITWGLGGDSNPFTGDNFNIFMGGYTNSNPTYSDATNSAKRIKYATTGARGGTGSSITFFHPNNVSGNRMGAWFRYTDSNVNANGTEVSHFNDDVTLTGNNFMDQFTKKGFFTVGSSTKAIPKTESPLFSTKILDWDHATRTVTVADASKLSGFRDDEFIIYRANYTRDARYYKTGLVLKDKIDFGRGNVKLSFDASGEHSLKVSDKQDPTATILNCASTSDTAVNYSVSSGDPFKVGDIIEVGGELMRISAINVTTNALTIKRGLYGSTKVNHADGAAIFIRGKLCVSENWDDLYISPYKYWIAAEIWNLDEDNQEPLPAITYDHSLITNHSTAPASTTLGVTHNERKYSDTISYSNSWPLAGTDKDGVLEVETDYGFGVWDEDDESKKGYINRFTPDSGVFNQISLDGLVEQESARFDRDTEKISLLVKTGDVSQGTVALHTTKSSNDPYLEFIFTDNPPKLENFKVTPYEADPVFPEYTWETQDTDLFYGFMMISNQNISSKYHNAVLHLPLNDLTATAVAYKYDGNSNRTAIASSEVLSSSTQLSREGLAGNCFTFDGNIRYIQVDDGDYTQPTSAFSLVAHFTCASIAATRYICSEYGSYRMWIDTSGNINAAATPNGGTEVVLKSSTLVVTDDETPYCAILTFDVSLGQGNLKLFINGKLEDQSGIKTTDGSANNWKAGTNLADGSKDFFAGAYDSDGNGNPDSGTYHYGKLEEVILYNDTLYPVVPQTGRLVLTKPVQELTTSNVASGISIVAKLFIMDFHNIRGMTSREVTSSSNISYRKSGLGLKTN